MKFLAGAAALVATAVKADKTIFNNLRGDSTAATDNKMDEISDVISRKSVPGVKANVINVMHINNNLRGDSKINSLHDNSVDEPAPESSDHENDNDDCYVENNSSWKDQHDDHFPSGKKSLVVVRVAIKDAIHKNTMDDLRYSMFESNESLSSQYKACSYGQLTFDKPISRSLTIDPGTRTTGIINNVMTVDLPEFLSEKSWPGELRTYALKEMEKVFGVSGAYELASYIMFCMPPLDNFGNWTGQAPIPGYASYVHNDYCASPFIPMHELGHDLGFHHAKEGDDEYGDYSGIMGNSHETHVCFNGANSYHTGWYKSSTVELNPIVEHNMVHEERIYGIADYNGSPNRTVLIKINRSAVTKEHGDYFVAFNRKAGINEGTREGKDQVIVTESYLAAWGSFMVAKLAAGTSHTICHFVGSGKHVVIDVLSINLTSNPAFADIKIKLGDTNDCPNSLGKNSTNSDEDDYYDDVDSDNDGGGDDADEPKNVLTQIV